MSSPSSKTFTEKLTSGTTSGKIVGTSPPGKGLKNKSHWGRHNSVLHLFPNPKGRIHGDSRDWCRGHRCSGSFCICCTSTGGHPCYQAKRQTHQRQITLPRWCSWNINPIAHPQWIWYNIWLLWTWKKSLWQRYRNSGGTQSSERCSQNTSSDTRGSPANGNIHY